MPKKVARNNGRSGRITLSGDELHRLGVDVGDEIRIDVAESPDVARALIETLDAESFVLVSRADEQPAD